MGTLSHRRPLQRRPLRLRRTPISPPADQLNRSLAASVLPSASPGPLLAPLREWSGRETRQYAEKQNDDRLDALLPSLPNVARALIRCDGANHRCSLPICAVCARAYRQGPIAQLHALAQAKTSYPGPRQVATIYLDLFDPGSLADADLRRAREMFRKRLDRAGFKDAILMGGIEVAGRRNGSAGCCTSTSSPSVSMRPPGTRSKPP